MKQLKKIMIAALALCAVTGTASAQHDHDINALDYRLQGWPKAEKFESAKGSEHLFLSGSFGGIFSFGNEEGRNAFGKMNRYMRANAYLGKWFTPLHALRVGVRGTLHANSPIKTKMIGVSADYMMNFSALTHRYKPGRVFEMYGIVGAGVDASTSRSPIDWQLNYEAHLGLQGNFRVSKVASLYIEPRLYVGNNNYDARTHWRGYDAGLSLEVGMTYQILERSQRVETEPFRHCPFGRNTFLSIGVGASRLFNSTYSGQIGPEGTLAFGKWFAPHSGLRIGVEGGQSKLQVEGTEAKLNFASAGVDYLLNLNSMSGYHRKSRFVMIALAGVKYAAASNTLENSWHNAFGGRIGLQGNLRLTSNTSLYVEPRLNILTDSFGQGHVSHHVDLFGEVVLGFTLDFGKRN